MLGEGEVGTSHLLCGRRKARYTGRQAPLLPLSEETIPKCVFQPSTLCGSLGREWQAGRRRKEAKGVRSSWRTHIRQRACLG